MAKTLNDILKNNLKNNFASIYDVENDRLSYKEHPVRKFSKKIKDENKKKNTKTA